jgi:ABC-type lipoprotein release transport system permease subunit
MDNLVTSNIRQRPIRTLVSVAGVALGVALVMLFTGLARGMSNELQRRATNVRAELIFMRPGAVQLTATTANLDTRYVDRLKQIEGIEEALPVIRHFNQGTKGIGIEQIDGVDWDAYARMNGISMVAGTGPQSVDEVVTDTVKAEQNNLHVGDRMKPLGTQDYRIAGIYSPESGARVKMSLAAMQKALEADGKCTFIFLKLRNSDQLQEVAQRIDRELPGNTIQPTREVFTSFERSIPLLGVFLRVLVVLAAVVSSLVVGEFAGGDAGDVYDDHGADARDRDLESDGRLARLHRRDHRERSDTDQFDRVGNGICGVTRRGIFDSQSLRVGV